MEAAERASDTWRTEVTDFQPPPVVAMAAAAVRQLAGVGCVAWGGYPQARFSRFRCQHGVLHSCEAHLAASRQLASVA